MKFITDIWRREVSFEGLKMKHDKPYQFYTSQWQISTNINIFYMLYRIAIALIFSITLILSVIDIHELDETIINKVKWLIYLTHWGYAVCTMQAFLSCYIVLSTYLKMRKQNELITDEPKLNERVVSVYWVLFSIATSSAFGITCIYWALIFNAKKHELNAMNIFVHGINSVLMMTDLFMVAHPVRLLHCYWPFLFAIVYIAFNIIYYIAGGTDKHGLHYVYAILDWEKPGSSSFVAFLALMFLVFLHFFTYGLFLLRTHIFTKYVQSKHDNSNSMNLTVDKKQPIGITNYNMDSSEYL